MKNWIVVLLIFIVPLGIFAYLDLTDKKAKNPAVVAQAEVSKPRVVKFYSPLCSECKDVSREMTTVVEDYKDAVTFEEINVSEQTGKNKALIKKYKITLVPTLIFETRDGQIVKKAEGFIANEEIKQNVEKIK